MTRRRAGVQTVAARPNYNYAGEALGLAARFVLTLAVELLIALPFGYLKRRHLRVLLVTNLATQLALNLALNLTCYFSGRWAMWLLYPLLELAVFIVEAVVFRLTLKKPEGQGPSGALRLRCQRRFLRLRPVAGQPGAGAVLKKMLDKPHRCGYHNAYTQRR